VKLLIFAAYLFVATCMIKWLGIGPAICSLVILYGMFVATQGFSFFSDDEEEDVESADVDDVDSSSGGNKLIAGDVKDADGNDVAI